jgi:hypothetical protein
MSRQQFTSRNDKGQILTFQKSGATASFDPSIGFSSGSKRVSWRSNNGVTTTQTAGNVLTYTGFTSDTGIRTIEMRGNSFKNINLINFNTDNLYGQLDLTPLSGLGGIFDVQINPLLTGITHSPSSQNFNFYQANNCNLTGNLDLTPLSGLGGIFQVQTNPYLTGITNPSSTQSFTQYYAYNCNLTGNLDLTPLSGLGGDFRVQNNIYLTDITHSPSSVSFTTYFAFNCNLIGNLDLTPLSGLGGTFFVFDNPLLTGITHSPSSVIFTAYNASDCNLTGNLDLTPLSGLGGGFNVSNNPLLTGITHSPSINTFDFYSAYNCNLTGNLDLSSLNVGNFNIIYLINNNYLTGITINNNVAFASISAYNCNLTGTLDLSNTYFGSQSVGVTRGYLELNNNINLSNILFPSALNLSYGNDLGPTFNFSYCDFGFIDFTPLSYGSQFLTSLGNPPTFLLNDNNMSADEVNHILADFESSAGSDPSNWSNIVLNIGGTNADPDSTSGGFDGLSAIATLTGSYGWTITY